MWLSRDPLYRPGWPCQHSTLIMLVQALGPLPCWNGHIHAISGISLQLKLEAFRAF